MHGLGHVWFEFLTCPCSKGVSVSAFSLACPEEQSFHKWSQTLLQGNIPAETKGWESHRRARGRAPQIEGMHEKAPSCERPSAFAKQKEASLLRTWEITKDEVREAKRGQAMPASLNHGCEFEFHSKSNEKSFKVRSIGK